MVEQRRATMKDVARVAGVSVQSVSNYTNGRWARLSAETRDQIEAAVAQLDYRVNSSARSLRSSRTRTLGLLALDDSLRFLADPLTGLYLAGLGDAAKEGGYGVLVQASSSRSPVDDLLTPLSEHRVDGACVLLSGPKATRKRVLNALDASEYPYVVLDEWETLHGLHRASSVRADQERGAFALVEHLIRCGHTRIAFMAARAPWAVVEQRYLGYRNALTQHGLPHDKSLCIFEGDWTPDSAVPMLHKLMKAQPRPTAVVCGSDLLAIGAIRGALDAGLAVPRDIAFTGFDDFDIARHTVPALTTVRVPAWEMGQAAARMLMRELADSHSAVESVCLPTELVLRESA